MWCSRARGERVPDRGPVLISPHPSPPSPLLLLLAPATAAATATTAATAAADAADAAADDADDDDAADDADDADAEWRGSWVRDSVRFRHRDGITADTKKFMMFCWSSAVTVRNRQKHPL